MNDFLCRRSTTLELSTNELIGMVVGTPSAFGTLAIQCLALCAVIYSHLIWFYERGINPQIGERYTDGIFDSFWLAIVTAATVNQSPPTPRLVLLAIAASLTLILKPHCDFENTGQVS